MGACCEKTVLLSMVIFSRNNSAFTILKYFPPYIGQKKQEHEAFCDYLKG